MTARAHLLLRIATCFFCAIVLLGGGACREPSARLGTQDAEAPIVAPLEQGKGVPLPVPGTTLVDLLEDAASRAARAGKIAVAGADARANALQMGVRVTEGLGAFFWREAATFVGVPLTIAGALL